MPSPSSWSVRQLYFDCAQQRPRVFDEGLPGFVGGVEAGRPARLSAVWWPADVVDPVAKAVADDALAQGLVGRRYQAHAYAWSPEFQNCNQWLVELVGAAFSGARDRSGAQAWLSAQGYRPSEVRLPWVGWLALAAVLPHLGLDGHPDADLQALQFRVSMPASIEGFIRDRWPGAQRVEWCRRGAQVVVRRGWTPLDEDCAGSETDQRIDLGQHPTP